MSLTPKRDFTPLLYGEMLSNASIFLCWLECAHQCNSRNSIPSMRVEMQYSDVIEYDCSHTVTLMQRGVIANHRAQKEDKTLVGNTQQG